MAVNFDIDCLRSFLVVVDSMSFSRAAETVGRSQSTISQQISKLETQVGKALLTRRKGKVVGLTLEGERLTQYARRILQLNDEAYGSMCDDALAGFLRLGVPLDFFGRDFTTWLARFKHKYPMVAMEVEANQSESLIKRSARGEFDLAFFKQETDSGNGTVAQREQLVWVSGPNYTCDETASVPLVLFPDGCAYRRSAVAALRSQQRRWHLSFVSPSFECLRTAAIEGLGLTVLARTLVTPPLRVARLDMLLPQLPTVELAYSFGTRKNSRAVGELAGFLVDNLARTSAATTDGSDLVYA